MADLKINIDPKDIQDAVVESILQSAIGEEIVTQVNKFLTEKVGDRWNEKNIF